MLRAFRAVASPGYPNDENEVATRASRTYDRSYDPNGVARQRIAWFASGDRTERLRHLDVPTLVIHSVANRVCDVSGGRATAEADPGAELVLIGEMGHNLPLTRFAVPTRSAHRRVRVAGGGPLSTSSRDSWRYARVYKDVTIAIARKSS